MCLPAVGAAFSSLGTMLGGTAAAGTAAAGTAAAGAGTLGTLSTIATLGSGIMSAYGQRQSAKAQEAVAKANARNAEVAADNALEAGREESDKVRRRASLVQGRQRASMAANGVDVTSADAIDLLDDSKMLAEEDAFTIRENARRRAEGMDVQSANYETQASAARSEGFYRPMGTLLTTGAKVGSKYRSWVADSYA